MVRLHAKIRAAVFLSLLWMIAGCGTESYEARFTESLDRATKASPFAGLQPLDLGDAPMSLRIPSVFEPGKRYRLDSFHPRDQGRISTNRLDMFLAVLPETRDFRLCCEAEAKDSDKGLLPYYLYVATGPLGRDKARTLAADIREELTVQFPGKTSAEWRNVDWKTVDVPTPSGGTVRWRKLIVMGAQPFRRVKDASDTLVNLPGRFELYLYQTDNYYVLLGWRAHAAFAEQLQLPRLAEITAGTLAVKAAPPGKAGPVQTLAPQRE